MSENNYKEDDYLATSNYKSKPKSSKYPEYSVFSQDGQSYFALTDSEDNVVIRSEGYATESSRNKGIESVEKNKTDGSKWSHFEKNGYYFLVLKAGNHQEIGRSKSYKSLAEAESALSSYLSTGSVSPPSKDETSSEAVSNNLMADAGVTQPQDILKSEAKEDDYLPCKEYEGHAINDKENNVALFKHKNGQFYFVLYNADGDVKIRSEGFETAKNRDQELSGVLKYHNDDSMYNKMKKGKYYMMVLLDKNGTEVGRSCLLKEESKIQPADNGQVSSIGKVVSSTVTSTRRVLAVEDDYLKCEAYKGHPVSDTKNNIALFVGDDSQLYFAVYNSDGSVRLRSEGFKSEVGRDNELQAVIKHMNDPNMYNVVKKGKYSIKVLKDSIGREVGRSCMYLDF